MKSSKSLKVVVGLGKTGISCVRYLTKQGYSIKVIDNRESPPALAELKENFPNVEYALGSFEQPILEEAEELVVSPGVSLSTPAIARAIKKGVSVVGDIELFAKVANAPVIAITGSNGKSSVTSMVQKMIAASGKREATGGNLGTPALDLLEQAVDFYVLELSSFQLETTASLKPAVSVILNVSPDHLDRYPSINEYLKAKQRVYWGSQAIALNRDDPLTYAGISLPKKAISFGFDAPTPGNFGINHGYLVYGEEKLLPVDALKIKGTHNWSNALAALAIGKMIELPLAGMLQALTNFTGLSHRCQWVGIEESSGSMTLKEPILGQLKLRWKG